VRKFQFKIFFILLFIFFGGCTTGSLADQFLADLSESAGVLEMELTQHLHDGSEAELNLDGSKLFSNDLGYEIELKEGFLHFHQLHLISAGDDPLCAGGMDQAIPLGAVQDLLGEDLLIHHMGSALIPMVFFCQFELHLGSEQGAAVKFHEGEPHPGVGSEAFHFSGTWTLGAESGDFNFTGLEPASIHGIFKAEEGEAVVEHPLHLHDGEILRSVLFGTEYDVLFDGVAFKTQGAAEQLETIYQNLPEAIHQDAGDHHAAGEADHAHP
jgi:hypothetical protein